MNNNKKYIIRDFDVFGFVQVNLDFIAPKKLLGRFKDMDLYMTQVYPDICHKMFEIFEKYKKRYDNSYVVDYNIFMSNLEQFCQKMCPSTIAARFDNGFIQTHLYTLAYQKLKEILKGLREVISDDSYI